MNMEEFVMREPGEEDASYAPRGAHAPNKRKPACKVFGYTVPATARNSGFTLNIPRGARLLRVTRNEALHSAEIYALVNPEMEDVPRFFYVVGTNYPLPDPAPQWKALEYVGTWFGHGKTWHLFEVIP